VSLPKPVDNNDKAPQPPLASSNPANQQLVTSDEERKRREAKRKSSIVLIGGAPPRKTPEQMAEESTFQKRGDMNFVLAKGKIIEAVLETAINSDFNGEIRAVISRDVFAEQGKIILIPKGSKVFGAYSTSGAYGRVDIIWNRIDLSSGYTITLDGIGIDNLGRKGEQGRVDNKFKERLTNAVLLSAFNIGVAAGLDKIVPPVIDSQASATSQAEATSIQQIALTANKTNPSIEAAEVARICSEVLATISDKTSAAYTGMQSACNTAQTSTGAQPGQNITAVQNAAFAASTSLLSTAATAAAPTQAQDASKQAFTDISNTVKDMITQQEFKPTTTIDQGTVIKIYVNKDYKFPQAVLKRTKVIK
jgi:type IV secretion system protein VirB10